MPDISQTWGSDLMVSATGDLATVDGPAEANQRIVRRLLTNPGDDLWSLDYGAGLPRFVGSPGAPDAIRAVVRSQLFKEPAVARSPAPVIDVLTAPDGLLYLHLRYADTDRGDTRTLALQIP